MSQRVDKFGRRREIRLARGDDVAARITLRRIPEHGVEELDIGTVAGRLRWIADRVITGRASRTTTAVATATAASTSRRLVGVRLLTGKLGAATRLGDRPLDLRDLAWRRRPRVAIPLLDLVLAHPVDVEQQLIALPRRVVEHRVVCRHRIVD